MNHVALRRACVQLNMRREIIAATTIIAAVTVVVLALRRPRKKKKATKSVRISNTESDRGQFQVLIVVDMQKDYDIQANIEMYGDVRCSYANDIARFVGPINAVRASTSWDRVVFTFDWLGADLLAGRTPFCLEGSFGATLLNDLEIDASRDVTFRKDSDDSFCDVGGVAERHTSCTRLGDVLCALGYACTNTSLVFVGQRFERCVLETVMHARALGYDCSVVMDATYAKTDEPDPEWSWGPEERVWEVRKAAGSRLSRGYLEDAGVRLVPSWPLSS